MATLTCTGCGVQFDNRSDLLKHKANYCPAGKQKPEKQAALPTEEAATAPAKTVTLDAVGTLPAKLLPLDTCPQEVAMLGPGRLVRLVVIGVVTEAGVKIEEVTFDR